MPSKVAREGGSEEFQSPMKGGCFEDINGEFSKNREDGKKELERQSGEVYADPEETFEEQRIEWYRKKVRNILPGKLRDNEVLPGTFHGMRAGSKLLEDRQIGISEETRRGAEEMY